ncbi:diphthine methyl ester synthase [Planococcus citri]|uniref:diphthine methyl ester synthase n=1 Tax=Planococcus citri TaxID=170843 RepID=UPI0031F98BF5
MFYLIGIGLYDEKDITVKGLEIVRKASRVYLEHYTSIIWKSKEDLEKFYGCNLILADREMVEMNSDEILHNSKNEDVVFLVAGDPVAATTHTDLILRANEKNIKTQIVHNASIFNSVACCGLQLYNFGETISIPYWTDSWKPDSFWEKLKRNVDANLHTLCLLDIQVKEPTPDSLTKKIKQYLPPRFMSVKEASHQLMQILQMKPDSKITPETLCVGLARVGASDQKIVACSLEEMQSVELGLPLHSLVIAAPKLHPLEEEYLKQFYIS